MLHTPNDFFKDFKGSIFDPDSQAHKEIMAKLPDERPVEPPEMRTEDEFWQECEIPLRFRRAESSLKRFDGWSAINTTLRNKIDHTPGFCIVLRGERGTGKTQLAVEALKYGFIAFGLRVKMTSARDIQLATTASFKKDTLTDREVLDSFIKPDLLLIDEFDWQPTDKEHYFNQNLFYILDKRYQWMKSTILTSNKSTADFEKTTDPGILSRMNEGGGCFSTDGFENFRTRYN